MKNLHLLSILIILFSTGLVSCHHEFSSYPVTDSLRRLSKSSIFIDRCDFGVYRGDGDTLSVSFFVLNNTNDTLKYTSTTCLFSRFYCVDNANMTIIDFPFPFDSVKRIVIPPHRGRASNLNFKLKKQPDCSFKFKIGIKLVQWHSGNNSAVLRAMASEKPDTIWSDVKVIKLDKNHEIPELNTEEYKEYILKKPLAAFFPPLTTADRKKYALSINQNKIQPLKDTIISEWNVKANKLIKNKYLFAICEVEIKNNSDDTLKYINMNCSWLEMYKINNVSFSIKPQTFCLGNFPDIFVVLPRRSSMIKIPLITAIKTNINRKIKIGLSLQKYIDDDDQFFSLFDPKELMLLPETSNMIWSNEVTLP